MVSKEDILRVLNEIPDPEIGISIVELGLVYDVSINAAGDVTVLMTLTSIGCPLFDLIAVPIKENVGKLPGVNSVQVELTFEPPWSMDRISEEAKMKLGFA